MFFFASDIIDASAVFLFAGKVNTDRDFERYIECVRALDERARERDAVCVQVVDRENTPPSAAWRKRIAESSRELKSRPCFALVTESAVIRGVQMAINWIRPPAFPVTVVARFDEGLRFCEAHRGRPVPSLVSLYADVRAQADKALREAAVGT